jgi:hypothetical protein
MLPNGRNNLTPYFNFDEIDKPVFNVRCLNAVQGIETTDVMTDGIRRPPVTWSRHLISVTPRLFILTHAMIVIRVVNLESRLDSETPVQSLGVT